MIRIRECEGVSNGNGDGDGIDNGDGIVNGNCGGGRVSWFSIFVFPGFLISGWFGPPPF